MTIQEQLDAIGQPGSTQRLYAIARMDLGERSIAANEWCKKHKLLY